MKMECCEFKGEILTRVLPPLLLLQCILGVLGNGLALWIFCFHLKPWRSSTVFLFNLALADFLLNVALPFRASYYLSGMDWRFGDAFCNISLFLIAMNRGGSTLFLMAIAMDRYVRVAYPHHPINSITVAKATCVAAGLWIITILMDVHLLTDFAPRGNTTHCESFMICQHSSFSLTWHKFVFIFSFFLTLFIILFCTIQIIVQLRRRMLSPNRKIRKALLFITVVMVLFVVCFLPSNVTELLIWFNTLEKSCSDLEDLNTAFYITLSLTYLNSMLDPMVYYFSSPVFRRIYKATLRQRPKEEPGNKEDDKVRETRSHTLSQL